jgi:hypothetical protein
VQPTTRAEQLQQQQAQDCQMRGDCDVERGVQQHGEERRRRGRPQHRQGALSRVWVLLPCCGMAHSQPVAQLHSCTFDSPQRCCCCCCCCCRHAPPSTPTHTHTQPLPLGLFSLNALINATNTANTAATTAPANTPSEVLSSTPLAGGVLEVVQWEVDRRLRVWLPPGEARVARCWVCGCGARSACESTGNGRTCA